MQRDERPATGRNDSVGIVARRRRDGGPHRYARSPFEAVEALLYLGAALARALVRGVLDH